MKVYRKLVRGRIPEIIEREGRACDLRVLPPEEYPLALMTKLREEVDEVATSGEVGELADILEVVYAIAEHKGLSRADLEELCRRNRDERGGFERRLFLNSVSEKETV